MLAHPIEGANSQTTDVSLITDASNIAVGAVLHQLNNKAWGPLGFYSKKLSSAEIKYTAFDRELLAVYQAIKHFRFFLEGRDFTVYTNHKPLVHALSSKTQRSPRKARHLDYISQFTSNIQYVACKENSVADALSRIDETQSYVVDRKLVDFKTLANLQTSDDRLFC